MLVDAGGWDHGWFLGNGCVAVASCLDRRFNGQTIRMRHESRVPGLAGIVRWLLTLDGGFLQSGKVFIAGLAVILEFRSGVGRDAKDGSNLAQREYRRSR